MKVAQIIVFRAVEDLYTYSIPDSLAELITPGTQVEIPFGKNKAKGLVTSIEKATANIKFELKPITSILKKYPKISTELLNFTFWLKEYYQLTPYKAFQTIIGDKKIRELENNTLFFKQEADLILNEEQQKVVNNILSDTSKKQEHLIFGVTGSGKTEVYIHLTRHIVANKKTAMILLPEIALTPQVRQIFQQRFGNQVAVIHSGLTVKQKEIEWNRIYQKQAQIVIGPRSAIFSPLTNIGMIIIDEEHEPSYKQENNPRYFTHTIAEYRKNYNKALLIYGSATPSIEQYHTASSNSKTKYLQLLTKRVYQRPMPKVHIINQNDELNKTSTLLISKAMTDALTKTLENKEKAIILVNRRGFAPYIICKRCGSYYSCPGCQLSYTYHKDKTFRCHRCNRVAPITNFCPKCNKQTLVFGGAGIQKVETELLKLFPSSKICRMDRDTIKNHTDLEEQLQKFREDGDILLGTQIIAKGHHFEDVTMVGVIGIDTVLNIPDFRATERVFQLLTQVAGRSGRGQKTGEVYIQTHQPDHYAIKFAAKHDYQNFFSQEIQYRQELWYPPFSALTNIILSSKQEKSGSAYAKKVAYYLTESLRIPNENIQIIGPKPAPIEMLNNYYRFNILIKCQHELLPNIKAKIKKLPKAPYSVRTIIDFDPKNIL